MPMYKSFVVGSIFCLVIVACSEAPQNEQEAVTQSNTKNPSVQTITEADFGESWPFIVDSGEIGCKGKRFPYFSANGHTYWLTGMRQPTFEDVSAVWKDNPNIPNTKVSLSDVIDSALKLCKVDA